MKIVVGPDIGDSTADKLKSEFPEVDFVAASQASDLGATAQDADAYLGRISRDAFLAARPSLRWVHSSGAGIETMAAIPELVESDVTLTNTRGGHATCIAEHAFAMLLALTRHIVLLAEDQRQRVWRRAEVSSGMRELSGMTMVVVGAGNIGRAIARRAVAFEMRVLGIDVHPGEPLAGVEAIWPPERLDEALAHADVLVVAAPQTAATRGLIDARRIALLLPDAYVIVVSRGGIVDEVALAAGLRDGKIAGAGLDVFATEPLPADDPIWDAPNLLVSPHCSGGSRQTRERVWEITRDNVRRFIAGEPLVNLCDKHAGF
ncbi:MAG: D-2-hydroxyacid dehydrogenase [Thermomicrobiales bacterium]